ncbi:MAG: malonyl-ACP O-methyltransferase BioC [Chlorobiaceae bacterium]|nr:malonyl-ACP O-methyltransferase BioC [Chlorobiaceae bacterium]
MLQVIDKGLVRERFSRTLHSYRSNATVQNAMAVELARLICREEPSCRFGRVLEIGAGTGAFTAELLKRCRISLYVANDLVGESHRYISREIEQCRPETFRFLEGDVETLTELPDRLDLVVSNASLQWLSDLEGFFRKVAALLKPGGLFAFTTFSSGNMQELASIQQVGLAYPSSLELERFASVSFTPLLIREDRKRLEFSSPEEVLRHLSRTGVNGIARHAWTKSSYEKFLHRYRADFSSGGKVYLTYRPLYCCFRKRLS